MKKIKNIVLPLIICAITASCSVAMAAKKEGTPIEKIQCATKRQQLISYGGEIINSRHNDQGQLVETFRFKKEKGSSGRALMHGALDVCTLGLWEVVGTPVEGYYGQNEFIILDVTSDDCGNIIAKNLCSQAS